jgi:hypothetical protein
MLFHDPAALRIGIIGLFSGHMASGENVDPAMPHVLVQFMLCYNLHFIFVHERHDQKLHYWRSILIRAYGQDRVQLKFDRLVNPSFALLLLFFHSQIILHADMQQDPVCSRSYNNFEIRLKTGGFFNIAPLKILTILKILMVL